MAIRVEDERPEVSDITFALNTSLKNVPLSKSASSLGSEPQLVEIANLEIASPLDPFTKVLTLDSLFLRFTLAGLLRREIDSLTIFGTDNLCRRGPLLVHGRHAEATWGKREGRLRSGMESQRTHALTTAASRSEAEDASNTGFRSAFAQGRQDVALDNLAALKLQAVLEIPPQKYVFDSYQLEFTSEQGELRFSYPPEKNVNNLVGTIRLEGNPLAPIQGVTILDLGDV